MNEELLKYAKGMNANKKVLTWLDKNVKSEYPQGQVEHIIDYLIQAKDFKDTTYNRVSKRALKWVENMNKKGDKIAEVEGDVEAIKDFKDGFKFVKLISENSYKREGFMMGSCVGGYFGKDDVIYSLRDKNNKPHATLSSNSMQIKGYGNGSIHPKYVKYNVEMLEELGMDVRDNEMKNLGYYNVSKFKKYLNKETKDLLFRKKYWFKELKLMDKKGEEFCSFDMWDHIPLVEESKKNTININFNLGSFNNNAIKFLNNLKDKKSNGYSAKIGSSGHSAKIGSSGDSAKIGSSGYSAVCSAIGGNSKIKAKIGSWIVLAEYDNYKPICVKTALIDGKKLKEDTYYTLKNKKFIEVEDE